MKASSVFSLLFLCLIAARNGATASTTTTETAAGGNGGDSADTSADPKATAAPSSAISCRSAVDLILAVGLLALVYNKV